MKMKQRPAAAAPENRRASSFFDLDFSDLRNVDAGELWRGVIQSQAVQGGKADIRGGCARVVGSLWMLTSLMQPLNRGSHLGRTTHRYRSVHSARKLLYDSIWCYVA